MHTHEQEILNKVIAILKSNVNPDQIILFGSRAKKENDLHADFDFAVNGKNPAISIRSKISQAIGQICGLYKIDIVYMDSVDKEFKNIILKTGKVIYEKK